MILLMIISINTTIVVQSKTDVQLVTWFQVDIIRDSVALHRQVASRDLTLVE